MRSVGGALDFTYRLARSSLPPRQQCVLFNYNPATFFESVPAVFENRGRLGFLGSWEIVV